MEIWRKNGLVRNGPETSMQIVKMYKEVRAKMGKVDVSSDEFEVGSGAFAFNVLHSSIA